MAPASEPIAPSRLVAATGRSSAATIAARTTTVCEGREWLQATLPDGTVGYVLGPSVRGHTTFLANVGISTRIEKSPIKGAALRAERPAVLEVECSNCHAWRAIVPDDLGSIE